MTVYYSNGKRFSFAVRRIKAGAYICDLEERRKDSVSVIWGWNTRILRVSKGWAVVNHGVNKPNPSRTLQQACFKARQFLIATTIYTLRRKAFAAAKKALTL